MKKIMFNDKYGLTKAVLEGRKTMTRRIVPQSVVDYYTYEAEDPTIIDAAKYDIGDVVAVAQKYRETDIAALLFKRLPGWDNKMFVRADLMPHRIRITDIKVERLQDISDEDCLKEGISSCPHKEMLCSDHYPLRHCGECFQTPREAFAALIDKVSGKGTWESNPWVFVYEFELVEE